MLSHYVNKDLIFINPHVENKDELFEKMVNHLYNLDYIMSNKVFLQLLKEREELSSTELIPGIALPHARSDSVIKLFLSIVVIKDGLDYGNPDLGDVNIVFFFGTSDKHNKEYLQLLAKSARLLKNGVFKNKLKNVNTPGQVIEILEEFDKDDEVSDKPQKIYQMIITFHLPHRLNDLLSTLVELGITNASVIEVSSLSNRISYDIPVFSGLYYSDKNKKKESYLILCHINDSELAHRLVKLLNENNINFNKKGTGFIQLIEAQEIIGNYDEDIDL